MKYNTTYTPKISLMDTIKKTEYVINEIESLFKSKYDLTKLISPLFLEEQDEQIIEIDKVTRPITFDMSAEYKVGRMLLSNSNWLRGMIKKLKLENKSGIYTQSSTIWRDNQVSPVSSISKNELTFQIKLDKELDVKQIVKQETESLFKLIQELETEFSKEYNEKPQYLDDPTYVTAQMMENEYPNISYKAREEEFAHELNGYIFENPAVILFSGHLHTNVPIEIYATRNFNQIVLKEFVNSSVLKVASIGQIANGQLLADQLSLSDKTQLREYKFYSNEIKNDYNVIEIKVNIGRLMMAVLKKGHISEVQPGNITDESNAISTKYKVEKY